MAVCDDLTLCLEAEGHPTDPKVILVRETEEPGVIVRTSRKNFTAFGIALMEGKYNDLFDPLVGAFEKEPLKWTRYDREDKENTAPPTDTMVWVVAEGEDGVTVGFFDSLGFQIPPQCFDDCSVTMWAPMGIPERPAS